MTRHTDPGKPGKPTEPVPDPVFTDIPPVVTPDADPFVAFDPGPAPATAEEVAVERAARNREAQSDDVAEPAEPKPYLVTGSQRVHETPPGEVVHLNPEAAQTARLVERGQIQPVDTTEGDE